MHGLHSRCLLALATRAGRVGALVGAGLLGATALGWGRAVLLMIAVSLGGCARLPPRTEPAAPPYRPAVAAGTALSTLAAASVRLDRPEQSAIRLLADGGDALQTRLALIGSAEKTLDVQYYLIANDRTGLEFLAALRRAAARGVQVRVLVDDLYATGEDALYQAMAATPNVSVRMFNPLPVRGDSFFTRIALSLRELGRIDHRMHNKLLVADGSFAVVGGRNIADEYFDRAGAAANFIDMDLLASGALVAELEGAFAGFWNSPHSYPLHDLLEPLAAEDPGSLIGSGLSSGSESIEPGWFAAQADMVPAAATLLADEPTKVDDEVGLVAEGHLALLDEARFEVVLASPYLVPGEQARATLRRDLARDVRVSVLTNSLATTDEPIVHLGYARQRAGLLAEGVSLNELRPEEAPPTDPRPEARFVGRSGSAGRLHGKLAVIDARTSFVGSLNLDRRSDRCNTEYGVVLRSVELAEAIRGFLLRQIEDRSYAVRQDAATGRLQWNDGRGRPGASRSEEPAGEASTGLATRLLARVVGDDRL